ncbi:MAG: class I SAM-dependent methyltransferase family protein, partial [Euryarchaeota archaeon]|nr:class I SAM-dependent methyltransferase family protein [Euryarchaeota archaeon]
MLAVRVPAREAERVRRELLARGLIARGYRIRRLGEEVLIPVQERARKELKGYELTEAEFEPLERCRSFEDLLRERLGKEELALVRRSFDIIGDIAIVEVPPELEHRKREIALALMEAHRNVKAVFRKAGEVRGETRVRQLEHLAGERRTETLHREHGLRLKLDVAKVYFSPRLAYERQRVLGQVRDGEVVVDLFAGVGPFALLIARHRRARVYAIDINPVAVRYLKENIALNRLRGEVVPLLGDAREVAPRGKATRVIMNLPKSSDAFLDLAYEVLRGEG